jgi:hypothetical protein
VPVSLRSLLDDGRHRVEARLSSLVPPDQRTDLRHRLGRYHPWESGFDFAAPPIPAGQATAAPDFVGVGVPAAGAEWWFALIADHPGVTAPQTPGVGRHFFSQFATRPFGPSEVERYHRWFPRRPGTIAGEWTPTYVGDPWVPPLLATAAPSARIIMLVRDPVERLRVGLHLTADMRTSNAGAHTAESVDRSVFARPLRELLHHYPADRVLVLQYERCVQDPGAELGATYRFLGLDDGHRPTDLAQPPGRADLGPLDRDMEHRLVDLYASDVSDLADLVPTLDLSLWPRFV